MTAVFINDHLLGFIPDETPIYGNPCDNAKTQNDTNHAIIKAWLLDKCKHVFKDKSVTYLPDKDSEFNGCLIINNKTLLRVTTMHESNVNTRAFTLLYKAAEIESDDSLPF